MILRYSTKNTEHRSCHIPIINHQSNGKPETYLKFVKKKYEKCLETNTDLNIALLQIKSMSIGSGFPIPAAILFNRLI